ncbi:MAG: carbon-nitrogen hydrolase family protein [Pseudomonadota bacterium]
MTKVTVTAIQAASRAASWEEKWEGADLPHALALLDAAAAQGATLACFPELYPLVGEAEIAARAKQHGMTVVAGLADGSRERWYNTSSIISPEGQVIGRQTKNYPTAIEIERGVVPGERFQVFDTPVGRLGIVICADFAFFNDGAAACREGGADMILNPAVWFALAEAFPHTVIGRHMEYSLPVIGVNLARPDEASRDARFPPAGGYTTLCIPPPVTDLDQLWGWFNSKPGGIDSTEGFVQTLGPQEGLLTVEVDLEAVRRFPGYFSTRTPEHVGSV